MGIFSPAETEYLGSQQLARAATVGPDQRPHVVPVTFRVEPDGQSVSIVGYNLAKSKKWRDLGENDAISLVIDDVLPPWQPRGIEVRGRAVLMAGDNGGEPSIRVVPERVISWGIDTDAYQRSARDVPGAPA